MAQSWMGLAEWHRLVLDPPAKARLEDCIRLVRHHATVGEEWGMAAGGSALVRLVTGESGTGKTLAAEAVALHLPSRADA